MIINFIKKPQTLTMAISVTFEAGEKKINWTPPDTFSDVIAGLNFTQLRRIIFFLCLSRSFESCCVEFCCCCFSPPFSTVTTVSTSFSAVFLFFGRRFAQPLTFPLADDLKNPTEATRMLAKQKKKQRSVNLGGHRSPRLAAVRCSAFPKVNFIRKSDDDQVRSECGRRRKFRSLKDRPAPTPVPSKLAISLGNSSPSMARNESQSLGFAFQTQVKRLSMN